MKLHFVSPVSAEPFDYRAPFETGIGGSETCHVEMAIRMAARGYDVTSYTKLPEDCPDRFWCGVTWNTLDDIDFAEDGLWIISRDFTRLDDFTPTPRRQAWVVAQDVDVPGWNPERGRKASRIFGLCPMHVGALRHRHPEDAERIMLSGNGIPSDLYDVLPTDVPRNPNRLMFASSPDRGLANLLWIFKRAREQNPQLELHVFYGLNTIENWIAEDPKKKPHYQHMFDLVEKAKNTPGVTYHGRVGQNQLRLEWLKSGIWCHPSNFCVVGDTPIDIPRNYQKYPRGVPIRELVGQSGFPAWCFDIEQEKFQLSPVRWVKKTRKNAEVWRVEFDDGTFIRATPDHKFLLRNTLEWRQLKDLQPNDSVLHLAKHMMVQVGVAGGRGTWPTEHRLIAEYLRGGPLPKGIHVDHKDGNCWNNTPDNIQELTAAAHAKKTFSGRTVLPNNRKAAGKRLKQWLENLSAEDRSQLASQASNTFWESLSPEDREKFIADRAAKAGPAALAANKATWAALSEEDRQRRLAGLKKGPQANKAAWEKKNQEQFANHKVVRVVPDGHEDVYCMKMDGPSNFVANGVVVHNCETSCITCMDAQALGAYPITTPVWGVQHNVDHGVFIPGDCGEPLTKCRYAEALAMISLNPEEQERRRQPMMQQARQRHSWERICDQYEHEMVAVFPLDEFVPQLVTL